MRHIHLRMAFVAALVVTMALASGVLAQEEATDEHPIVGAWITDATPDDAIEPDELTVFLPGGVVIDAAGGGTGAGTWSPTGERTADLTFAAALRRPGGRVPGPHHHPLQRRGLRGWPDVHGHVHVRAACRARTGDRAPGGGARPRRRHRAACGARADGRARGSHPRLRCSLRRARRVADGTRRPRRCPPRHPRPSRRPRWSKARPLPRHRPRRRKVPTGPGPRGRGSAGPGSFSGISAPGAIDRHRGASSAPARPWAKRAQPSTRSAVLAREALPAGEDDVAEHGVDLHPVADAGVALGRDERRARPEEGVVERLAGLACGSGWGSRRGARAFGPDGPAWARGSRP